VAADVVPVEIRVARRLGDLRAHRLERDAVAPVLDDAAARVGLDLERREDHDVGVRGEELDEARDLVEVSVVDRGVEDDVEPEPPHPLDVLLAHGVEVFLGRVALALLREVDVDRDVREAGRLQLLPEVARELDAVRHEGGLEPQLGRALHDGDELLALPERGVAAVITPAVGVATFWRRSMTSQGMSFTFSDDSEVAERAVEVAALGDLHRDQPIA
jgi:hypothetical protein